MFMGKFLDNGVAIHNVNHTRKSAGEVAYSDVSSAKEGSPYLVQRTLDPYLVCCSLSSSSSMYNR